MAIDFETVIFVIVSGAAVIGALGCVFSARVAHSLLWLMFTFFAVAGAFLMASAEMLSAIQILVYLGSVMLVVQFGVMLTRRRIQDVESLPTLNALSAVSGIGVFAFILALLRGVMEQPPRQAPWSARTRYSSTGPWPRESSGHSSPWP